MIYKETNLKGSFLIEIEPKEDERGFFARSFCREEFKNKGIDFKIVQSNISYNKKAGTLRGMHYQIVPYEESKIVSCVKGRIYDVIIDLREDSATYCKWTAIELNADNFLSIYIPEGFAHGFQTLEDDTVVSYQMSEYFHTGSSQGVRWNDPAFKVNWPMVNKRIISAKDRMHPDFTGKGL